MKGSGRSLIRLFATCAAAVVISCARSTACDPATADCGAGAANVVNVGEDIVLAPGQPVVIANSGVQFAFERVVSDSRCARDVQCVWAGNAAMRLRVWVDGDAVRTMDLNTTVEPKSGQLSGYSLRVVALTPEPVSTSKIEPTSYRLTVRLERP